MFPIGRYTGRDGAEHEITLAGRTVRLPAEHFSVWAFAHGPVDPVLARNASWDRTALEWYARLARVDAPPLITELAGSGLLAGAPVTGPGAVGFARRHRAVPLMLGLGNTAGEPERFRLGFFGEDLIDVDAHTYDVWSWSAVEPDLWAACDASTDPDAGNAAWILGGFLRDLHRLLSVNAVHLDLAGS